MTLTFNLATWFLFATYCLIMIIICAIFFSIPPCITKLWVGHEQVSLVFAQSLSADFDLELLPSDMVLVRDTLSCHDNYLCRIIFKSQDLRLSYGPDTILEHAHTRTGNTL